MNPFEGASRKLGQVKAFVGDAAGIVFVVGLETRIDAVKQLPDDKRKQEALNIVKQGETALPLFRGVAYMLHHELDLAHRLIAYPTESVKHAGLALDLHPSPNAHPDSDYPDYVTSYLEAIKLLSALPSQQEAAGGYRDAIARLGRIQTRVPRLEYAVEGNIGWCFDQLKQYTDALPHHERGILLHPNSGENNDFPTYGQNFINDVRLVAQEAIRNLTGREREKYIEQLLEVVNATGRVARKYPNLEGLRHEHTAAYRWFEKTVGPDRIHRIVIGLN